MLGDGQRAPRSDASYTGSRSAQRRTWHRCIVVTQKEGTLLLQPLAACQGLVHVRLPDSQGFWDRDLGGRRRGRGLTGHRLGGIEGLSEGRWHMYRFHCNLSGTI